MSPQLSGLVVSAATENIARYFTTRFGADGSGCRVQSCGSRAIVPCDAWATLPGCAHVSLSQQTAEGGFQRFFKP